MRQEGGGEGGERENHTPHTPTHNPYPYTHTIPPHTPHTPTHTPYPSHTHGTANPTRLHPLARALPPPHTSPIPARLTTLPPLHPLPLADTPPFPPTPSRSTVATSFRLLQRKAFSLPKLALFPGIALAHPGFVAASLPVALIVDSIKSKGMAQLSAAVEALKREEKRIEAVRSRVQVKPRIWVRGGGQSNEPGIGHCGMLRPKPSSPFSRCCVEGMGWGKRPTSLRVQCLLPPPTLSRPQAAQHTCMRPCKPPPPPPRGIQFHPLPPHGVVPLPPPM